MPIYEFVCQECQNLVELLVRKPSEEVELRCSACGSGDLQRVVSRVNSVVTGGGHDGCAGSSGPGLEERNCPTGNCSTLTLPGHSR